MNSKKNQRQSIWWNEEKNCVSVIDQRWLPHKFFVHDIHSLSDSVEAIKNMTVRGAPLIGVTAAYGFYLATLETNSSNFKTELQNAYHLLLESRPTAVNLKWALDEMMKTITNENDIETVRKKSYEKAAFIKNDDIERCRKIGEHGLKLIEEIAVNKKGERINILTHCNAGRLACVEWGTATSAIYQAANNGIDVHVWVDETRPRNQGASLTAYELSEAGIAHTAIPDNTGGHLMQHAMVDLVIVGADRISSNGDTANKIGTYLKALAAKHNKIPFYVAASLSTFDFSISGGKEIVIETRDANEVKYISGKYGSEVLEVLICPENSPAINYGFDVTPAELITGFITEKGIYTSDKLISLANAY